MGTSVNLLFNIINGCFGANIAGPKRYLDFGAQELYGGSQRDYEQFIQYCRGGTTLSPTDLAICEDLALRSQMDLNTGNAFTRAKCSELFQAIGWDYHSIDLYESTIRTDLNMLLIDQIDGKFRDYFDIVANFGTTEHVLNQFLCFWNIHAATKVGGFMVHMLPSSGFLYHCLLKYEPKFFLLLAQQNNYKILHAGLFAQGDSAIDDRHATWAGYGEVADLKIPDLLVEFVLQKQEASAVNPCYDTVGTDLNVQYKFDPACTSLRAS
jgi:hypothetical protein